MSRCRAGNWSKECEEHVNQQIGLELYAAHTYNAMHAYFARDSVGFPGAAEYFKKAADEELGHARAFMAYQNTRGGCVQIGKLEAPLYDNFDCSSAIVDGSGTRVGEQSVLYKAFAAALELEDVVYSSILGISKKCDDPGLEDFLDDFIKEQLEGQYELGVKLKQLERIGNDGHGLLFFDQEILK